MRSVSSTSGNSGPLAATVAAGCDEAGVSSGGSVASCATAGAAWELAGSATGFIIVCAQAPSSKAENASTEARAGLMGIWLSGKDGASVG